MAKSPEKKYLLFTTLPKQAEELKVIVQPGEWWVRFPPRHAKNPSWGGDSWVVSVTTLEEKILVRNLPLQAEESRVIGDIGSTPNPPPESNSLSN